MMIDKLRRKLIITTIAALLVIFVVMVGAMIVAGIETVATGKISRTEDIQEMVHNMSFAKGDELGRFYLGSTAIVVLPKGAKADWQDSLQANSMVKMGQLLGVANK